MPWTSPLGAQLGPGLREATRGRGPARPGESDSRTSFPVSHPWPDPVPSAGPGTALAVTSASPGSEEAGVGGDCCRQPETPTGPLFSPPASAPGQFFELDVYHSDGTPLTSDQIFVQLEKIWNSSLQTNKEPVGILTSNHRNSWAKAYNTLIKGAPGVRGHIPTSVHTRPWTGFSFSLNPRDSEQVSLAHFTDEETEAQWG